MANFVDIIEKKKLGLELSDDEIKQFVDGVCGKDGVKIPDYQTAAFLMAVRLNGMTFKETATLTLAMRDSGKVAKLKSFDGVYVDKHSTGGVGDSTTFVVLPALAACGCKVVKMSGRGLGHTGGTIDKIEAICGYKTSLSPAEIEKQADEIGMVLIGQSDDKAAPIAPADKILYALRDVTSTVDSIPLIVSSIMSKKLASGSDAFVFDVKYGSGAFLKTIEEATTLGEYLKEVGRLAGHKCAYVLSSMDEPLDEYIGNSLEVYGALQVLKGEKNALYETSKKLSAEALILAGLAADYSLAEDMFEAAISSGAAYKKFRQLVAAQGGDVSFVDDPNKLLSAKFRAEVVAEKDGKIKEIDTEALGRAMILLDAGRRELTSKLDLYTGIKMNVRLGDSVKKGDSLVTVFYNQNKQLSAAEAIKNAIEIG